jgi:hypothetical protein
VIGSVVIIILLLFALHIYFTPIPEKLEISLPNAAGAYYVPQSMQQASLISGIAHDGRDYGPTKYDRLEYVQWFEKTYIRNDGPFEIVVSISYMADTSPEQLDAIYQTTLYNNEKLEIGGRTVDCSEFTCFSWHGKEYIVPTFIYAADSVSEMECRDEGINFLNSFIPEFEKTNRFN